MPVAITGEFALSVAVFLLVGEPEARLRRQSCFPAPNILPPDIVEFAAASSVFFHRAGILVQGDPAAKVVAIVEASTGGTKRIV